MRGPTPGSSVTGRALRSVRVVRAGNGFPAGTLPLEVGHAICSQADVRPHDPADLGDELLLHVQALGELREKLWGGNVPEVERTTGIRGGLGLGWMFVIAAELMGASEGLGYLLLDGQMAGNSAQIMGSLVLFAILGKATDAVVAAVIRHRLAWRDGFGGG